MLLGSREPAACVLLCGAAAERLEADGSVRGPKPSLSAGSRSAGDHLCALQALGCPWAQGCCALLGTKAAT